MSDARWLDVEADAEASKRHFTRAVAIHRRGGFERDDLDGYVAAMALMHAMQAGYTALEAALLKILDLLGEDAPGGGDWHRDLLRRCGRELGEPFRRPAILDAATSADAEEARRFRHRAAHSYDGFDPARAVPSVEAAERLASSFPLAVERFRRTVDPEID